MQTRTMMDEVADAVADLELGEKQARRLQEVMQLFQARAGRSLSQCRAMPGFRKLWDGLEEACRFALGPADMTNEGSGTVTDWAICNTMSEAQALLSKQVQRGVDVKEKTQFEVSAAWMKSCGLGSEAKVFPVLRTQHYPKAADWCAVMVIVERDGREWTVAQGRGKFI